MCRGCYQNGLCLSALEAGSLGSSLWVTNTNAHLITRKLPKTFFDIMYISDKTEKFLC